MKPYQHYIYALLQNPEWMKSTIARYGRNDAIGAPELATAIDNLESALRTKFDLDDDAVEASVVIGGPLRFNAHGAFDDISKNEFEVEGFLKDSEPPKAGP